MFVRIAAVLAAFFMLAACAGGEAYQGVCGPNEVSAPSGVAGHVCFPK